MHRVLFTVSALLGLALTSVCGAQTPLQAQDFEDDVVGQLPAGWFCPTPDYKAAVTQLDPAQGQLCVELSSGDEQKSPFGNLMRTMDADSFRGKRIRLRAAVRVESQTPADRAQLWLRVDRADQRMGFFDNMGDRPIRAAAWKYYEITGDVAPDAAKLNIGLMLMTRGHAWLDDVSLTVLGDAASQPADAPRPLTPRGLDNLVAFTRLLGYVRYFHPSDAARDADWAAFTVAGVRKVEAARDENELARILTALFQPIAPTVCIYAGTDRPPLPPALARPSSIQDLRVAHWEHNGVGLDQPGVYQSTRKLTKIEGTQLPEGLADPNRPFEANLGAGVRCLVPLALWADGERTLPQTSTETPATAPTAATYTGDERATRLADVALVWNVFQHFYPYFDVVETDWPTELRQALAAAAMDRDERAFLNTLRLLVSALHDGHGGVYHRSDPASAALPLAWDWIEDSLVVTGLPERTDTTKRPELKIGDVIEQIGGQPVAAALADIERRTPAATPQFRRWAALGTLRQGPPDKDVVLKLRAANPRFASLRPVESSEPVREQRPDKITEIRPGVFYIDMARVTDADFMAALAQLDKATGIVFDFRGYPSHISPQTFFPHLSKTVLTSPQWLIPLVTRPDRQNMTFARGGEWNLFPAPPYLTARRAFIIDGRAISYAESCLGIVEHYHLGEFVGSPTAGTNGNVNPFTLPGGYRVTWTGMKVLKQDGARHHGVGIKPTIPATRTIEGVRAGRDELLEKALASVSEPPPAQPPE